MDVEYWLVSRFALPGASVFLLVYALFHVCLYVQCTCGLSSLLSLPTDISGCLVLTSSPVQCTLYWGRESVVSGAWLSGEPVTVVFWDLYRDMCTQLRLLFWGSDGSFFRPWHCLVWSTNMKLNCACACVCVCGPSTVLLLTLAILSQVCRGASPLMWCHDMRHTRLFSKGFVLICILSKVLEDFSSSLFLWFWSFN
jgi:hypothetical protein